MFNEDVDEQDTLDGEPDELPPPDETVETRGLSAIMVRGVLGLITGALVGPACFIHKNGMAPAEVMLFVAAVGAGAGTLVGLALGAFVWAFFPYRKKTE